MPRPTFADPKTGFAFKRIFGSEEHKDVLVAFLNDMLDLDEPHRIVSVEWLPPTLRPVVAELELATVYVECVDARRVTYVVEMQVLQVEGFERRVVDSVEKAYVNQIAHGELYPGPHDVVGVTLCDFEIWPANGEREIPMLSRWRTTEPQSGAREMGQIYLVFLELPKYHASQPPRTKVEKWAYFFREADKLEIVPEVLREYPFVDALEAMRTARFTVAEWDAHILSGIGLQNKRGALSVAEKRGRQQGREEGLRIGIEALCGALGIELTEERRQELGSLDAARLTELLAHLRETKAWR